MGMFSLLKFDDLGDLFLLQLQDLYNTESRLLEALPMMADAAHAPELTEIFFAHREQTKTHLQRLEGVFRQLGQPPEPERSSALKGLILDGEEILKARGDVGVRDIALIGAARRIEHHEMAGYDTARILAEQLGLPAAAEILKRTLDEEAKTEQSLAQLAQGGVPMPSA